MTRISSPTPCVLLRADRWQEGLRDLVTDGGSRARVGPRQPRDRRQTSQLCRSHNPSWLPRPDGRLPLRSEELHKLATDATSLLVRTRRSAVGADGQTTAFARRCGTVSLQHDSEPERGLRCSQANAVGACSASQTTRLSKRPSTRDSMSALGEGIVNPRPRAAVGGVTHAPGGRALSRKGIAASGARRASAMATKHNLATRWC